MHPRSLLIVAPLLLLATACTINGGDPGDEQGASESTGSPDSEGHSSDPTAAVTTTATDTADTDNHPVDDPDNDGCVPQDGPGLLLQGPVVRAGTDTDASTGTDATTGTDTDATTGGDTDATTGEQPCEPLPEENPVPADINCDCDVPGEHRSCTTIDDLPGTRFCDTGSWGPCIAEPECFPGTYITCFVCDETFGTWVSWCNLAGGVPHSNADEDCSTPLVLSFDGRPVEYSSDHAEFAMSAGDRCGARDWPTAATPWLAIDLDRNGNIDGGHELFGTGSRLAGRVDNGFAALAALDANSDGQISASDDRFAELVVWADHDNDRRSNLWELQPLTSHGVVAIDLGFELPASRCDARGNCEGERASFIFEGPDGARSSGEIVDIRLACQ
ncbi:calcium-binding protein [Nannocystis sp.]|uniref:calcium-binding protein n=1 Tax=Nannocystis sp. TaxID=1962667 RepID=UPI0025DBBC17|nr:calcium-binding protein [Nannocystis sp.]MBK7828999.1 calcium-binding protein [Nannocystis sp.]